MLRAIRSRVAVLNMAASTSSVWLWFGCIVLFDGERHELGSVE
jgi:hypothetical protein